MPEKHTAANTAEPEDINDAQAWIRFLGDKTKTLEFQLGLLNKDMYCSGEFRESLDRRISVLENESDINVRLRLEESKERETAERRIKRAESDRDKHKRDLDRMSEKWSEDANERTALLRERDALKLENEALKKKVDRFHRRYVEWQQRCADLAAAIDNAGDILAGHKG